MPETIAGQDVRWLLASDEPWTRYRTLVDLLQLPDDDEIAIQARAAMVKHPQVQALVAAAQDWPGYALKRHNDARHPLYALSTLADFGLRYDDDPRLQSAVDKVMANQSAQGPFETRLRLYKQFGGLEGECWTWIACDAPTLTYALAGLGLEADPRVLRAVEHLRGLTQENGWGCAAAPELRSFHGPGRREHPCPIANVYALKALALRPDWADSMAAQRGLEMLLSHWQQRGQQKYYLFGIGTEFRKLKYPFVWYDILHVTDVLSRFASVHDDPRFHEMLGAITSQADENERYTATAMYRSWNGWSFADKKRPSPWLTFLVRRMQSRLPGDCVYPAVLTDIQVVDK